MHANTTLCLHTYNRLVCVYVLHNNNHKLKQIETSNCLNHCFSQKQKFNIGFTKFDPPEENL